jgi:hypothetical protein
VFKRVVAAASELKAFLIKDELMKAFPRENLKGSRLYTSLYTNNSKGGVV